MKYCKPILLLGTIATAVVIIRLAYDTDRNHEEAVNAPMENRNIVADVSPVDDRVITTDDMEPAWEPDIALEPDRSTSTLTPTQHRVKDPVFSRPSEVSAHDLGEVYAYLLQTGLPADMTLQNFRSSKNSIMDALVTMMPPPTGLVDTLIDIAANGQQDIVVRDYALQHLVSPFHRARADERSRIVETLIHAASHEKDSSLPGTALLALNRLSQKGHVETGMIGQLALTVATDDTTGALARITAIQLCADLGVQDVAAVAEKVARQGSSEVMRRSAQSALMKLSLNNPELADRVSDIIQGENCYGCL